MNYDSSIFEAILHKDYTKVLENTEPLDITESIHIDFTDENINKANCYMIAYNIHVDETDDSEAYNPKKNPDKAIDIILEYPDNDLSIEIFLDTLSREWDSHINNNGRLSPEQMESFFNTEFYHKLQLKLINVWPESDELFSELLLAIKAKKYKIDISDQEIDEDGNVFDKLHIDKDKSREKNASGKQIRTRSGRKIITPSDFDVKHDENEAYFVWPEKNKEFKWSQWADWKKIHPVARIRFTLGQFTYGVSFSPFLTDDDNRGAKAYNLDLEPKLQYLTPEETQQMMKLTIVSKFLRHAAKRISRFLSILDDEIFNKVNRPDKCTIDDIRKTKHVLKNTLRAIKDGRADTYIYT